MGPELGTVVDGLPTLYAQVERTLLQLQLQNLQEQHRQRCIQLLFAAAAEQDRIRHGLATVYAAGTPELLTEVGLPSYANSATIGHRALAVAMVKAAMNMFRDDY
jgi:hypothetical protein